MPSPAKPETTQHRPDLVPYRPGPVAVAVVVAVAVAVSVTVAVWPASGTIAMPDRY
ncbi:hypothetical protein [Actinomadura sp. 9N215]|uniref:hypothetical protein n=1 Tax=Actinomadura sp. 9N215 TaxID=3375150 RepID=UPI0037B282BA